MCHSDPTSGHFGVKKTFNRVRERFYWKGMCRDTEEVCTQQQTGGSDCGLFAIAFAVTLVHGQDPACLTFDQAAMRQHLRLCLQRKRLDPFSTVKQLKLKKNRVVGREVETIYCLYCLGRWGR